MFGTRTSASKAACKYLPPPVSMPLLLHLMALRSCHLQTLSPVLLQAQLLALPSSSVVLRGGGSAQAWAHYLTVGVHGPQPVGSWPQPLRDGCWLRASRRLEERVLKSKESGFNS